MEDNFFNKVYEVVRIIPIGRVTSYGAIGKYLGSAKSARMVGWALNKCPNDVPAHRIAMVCLQEKRILMELISCNNSWKMKEL